MQEVLKHLLATGARPHRTCGAGDSSVAFDLLGVLIEFRPDEGVVAWEHNGKPGQVSALLQPDETIALMRAAEPHCNKLWFGLEIPWRNLLWQSHLSKPEGWAESRHGQEKGHTLHTSLAGEGWVFVLRQDGDCLVASNSSSRLQYTVDFAKDTRTAKVWTQLEDENAETEHSVPLDEKWLAGLKSVMGKKNRWHGVVRNMIAKHAESKKWMEEALPLPAPWTAEPLFAARKR